jgi:hypothetical protein
MVLQLHFVLIHSVHSIQLISSIQYPTSDTSIVIHAATNITRGLDWQLDLLDHNQLHKSVTVYYTLQLTTTESLLLLWRPRLQLCNHRCNQLLWHPLPSLTSLITNSCRKSKFHGLCLNPLILTILVPSLSHYNYQDDDPVKPHNLLTKWCPFFPYNKVWHFSHDFHFYLLFCYTFLLPTLTLCFKELNNLKSHKHPLRIIK